MNFDGTSNLATMSLNNQLSMKAKIFLNLKLFILLATATQQKSVLQLVITKYI